MFSNRDYRCRSARKGLVPFVVTVKETDLHIQACADLSDIALRAVLRHRSYIESFIESDPLFGTSFKPVEQKTFAPAIIKEMIDASKKAGVGPMAAIAGAVSQFTGLDLLEYSDEVIVENGGDIFFKTGSDTTFTIFAGNSPLSMKIGVKIQPQRVPMGLCTSSGTIGHSRSFGNADAVTVISPSCTLADAAATALANMVKTKKDIEKAIETGKSIKGVKGILVIIGDKLGAWGELELVPIKL
ncbi:conserved hypothetical protein [Desulfamplus magnetovallimortis]|uniref:Uncharacterized protein n=1 Tax=Desulfamplus magnetovallimortis TaxID=1246637 RepID=A0A1W1HDZ5_9BACT|nr:UPF0280 family protein [Desulfamplus magnetovallimortis]SLM30602.1 conserved hypothetical protein [Desulfamplus magnetovallimortis]